MKDLTILKPDDWHLHLREGIVLKNIIGFTSEFFGRAIVMPNTKKPITSIENCITYKKSISEALSGNSTFEPLMTIYLTDKTTRTLKILLPITLLAASESLPLKIEFKLTNNSGELVPKETTVNPITI